MVKYNMFMDILRQEDINKFYDACQLQREYYKGYPNRHHPFSYFRDPEYFWQCPPDISPVYLGFPSYHVGYKKPVCLPVTLGNTTEFPQLPNRSLAPRYNKPACKAFIK